MYGKQALDYIHDNSRTVGLVARACVVLAGGVAYYVWKRRSRTDPKVGPTA